MEAIICLLGGTSVSRIGVSEGNGVGGKGLTASAPGPVKRLLSSEARTACWKAAERATPRVVPSVRKRYERAVALGMSALGTGWKQAHEDCQSRESEDDVAQLSGKERDVPEARIAMSDVTRKAEYPSPAGAGSTHSCQVPPPSRRPLQRLIAQALPIGRHRLTRPNVRKLPVRRMTAPEPSEPKPSVRAWGRSRRPTSVGERSRTSV
jgi:hypothetical protein